MVYVVNGKGQCGKDFFIDTVQFFTGSEYSRKVSTIDPIKLLAKEAGWDGVKDMQSRRHLSELKSFFIGWLDTPFKYIEREYEGYIRYCGNHDIDLDKTAFFIICREPSEIERLKERFGAKAILIKRQEVDEIIYGNSSDDDVGYFNYDIEISNNGTKEEFITIIQKFIKKENLHYIEKEYIIDLFGDIKELEK